MEEKNEFDFEKLANEKKTSKSSRFTTFVLLLLCIVLTVAILFKMFTSAETLISGRRYSSAESAPVNVSVLSLDYGTFVNISRVNGSVTSREHEISVVTDIGGTVTELLKTKGDRVESGDIIAYVDASKPGSSYKASPVTATVSGTITDLAVSVGSSVSQQGTIATVLPESELIIETKIPEKFLSTISEGMNASFESVAYPGKTYTAVLTYISPKLSTSSRTADAELTITGDASGLKEGMYVKINLETEHIEDVLIVPQNALYTYLNNDVVYLAKDGVSERTIVTLGSSSSESAVVLSGLEKGDLVITAGTVSNGTSINIVEGDL